MSIEDEKRIALKVLKIIGMVILGVGIAALFGFVIMWLWNWLMPMIFGLVKLNYWQAVGLFVLAKIFFGGISSGGSSDKDDDCDDFSSVGEEIKSEFRKEFRKEWDKEWEKEMHKRGVEPEASEDTEPEEVKNNDDYDAMYDAWWESEGEKRFQEFMDQK